ncbi:Tim44 domain-containing protein [Rhodoligotrophos ferricapiens]|uniref:Tim44 domain-containing protein n=1 Tax=Rhodoligotrophos ferricapiens TaxID=3069264 RepID=UPI00315CFCA5
MTMPRTLQLTTLFAGLVLAFSVVAMDYAEARRGGSFGSRGMRTYQPAPPTRTVPRTTAPVERSMTPNPGPSSAVRQTPQAAQRPGLMNGFGGSMLRGLMLGGLIGLLLGHGFGGLAGMFGLLLQVLLIGGAILLFMRLFRSHPARSPASVPAGNARDLGGFDPRGASPYRESPSSRSGGLARPGAGAQPLNTDEIGLTQNDLDTFERRLTEVQEAFGREDHAALRRLATPEMVSYLSEELAENAKNGLRNDVSGVTLLQADIAESWREGDNDYATAAMHYSSRDVTRDRASGRIIDGNADHPTETTELWTFTRKTGGDWKLSAIQEA